MDLHMVAGRKPRATSLPHEHISPSDLPEDHEHILHVSRAHLEDCWKSHTQLPAPPLSQQGCTRLINDLYKCVLHNDVGTFPCSEIIAESPDISDCLPRSDLEGEATGTHESWAKQITVWCNTLLMCIWANPNASKLQITKKQLDDFYHQLMGNHIYKSSPLPPLRRIATSERRCWQQIRELVHQGFSLGESLAKMGNNSLFWQRELREHHPYNDAVDDTSDPDNTADGIAPNREWPPSRKRRRPLLLTHPSVGMGQITITGTA